VPRAWRNISLPAPPDRITSPIPPPPPSHHPEISSVGLSETATPGAGPPAKGSSSGWWRSYFNAEHQGPANSTSDGLMKTAVSAKDQRPKWLGAHIYGPPRPPTCPGDRQTPLARARGCANSPAKFHTHPTPVNWWEVAYSRPPPSSKNQETIAIPTISNPLPPGLGDSPPSHQSTGEGGHLSVTPFPHSEAEPRSHPRKIVWRRT